MRCPFSLKNKIKLIFMIINPINFNNLNKSSKKSKNMSAFEESKKSEIATMNTLKELNQELYDKVCDAFTLASIQLANCDKDVTLEKEKIFSSTMWKPAFAPDQYMLDFFTLLKKEKKIAKKPKSNDILVWIYQNKDIFLATKKIISESHGVPTSY